MTSSFPSLEVKGYVTAIFNVGTDDINIEEKSKFVNDGKYHIVKFTRSGGNATLQVDDLPVIERYPTGNIDSERLAIARQRIPYRLGRVVDEWLLDKGRQLTIFNSQMTIQIGGWERDHSRAFQGQMSGFYYNGLKVFNMAVEGDPNIRIEGSVRLVGEAQSSSITPQSSATVHRSETSTSVMEIITTTTSKHQMKHTTPGEPQQTILKCLECMLSRSRTWPDPEPSLSPPQSTTPEPPADWKLPPVETIEPTPEDGKAELNICLEPKHLGESDQGCELTSSSIAVGVLTSTKPVTKSSSSPISPAVSPRPPLSGDVTPWTCWEPTPPGRYEPVPPPQPHRALFRLDPAPAPTLLLPSTPASTIKHSASPGSLGPSAPPGSDSSKDLRDVRCSPALHPFGFGKLRPHLPRSSAFYHRLGLLSARWAPPPKALSPSVLPPNPLPSWFLQLSTPPWAFGMAVSATDDLLVASAECPSDDEDIDPCEPSSANPTGPVVKSYPGQSDVFRESSSTTGMVVGIVVAAALCILILLYAMYKYRNRDEGSYHVDESRNYICNSAQSNGSVVKEKPMDGTSCVSKSKKNKNKEYYV
ncbi:Neurexin-1a-beta [Anabarilius grahami]|uniref:Neurexin-1a-beta n=1 Tax=Anabarilius grahami TaxID=495550 RepID=A0A3N0YDK7_ANAGA|nr:Neurexin-1a-beta [Anabarilius grahami]